MKESSSSSKNQPVYIRLTDSNRIKYERLTDFAESVFTDVYAKAFHMLGSLLKENHELNGDMGDRDQIYNVIAFLGERGMGKTSAMLSFAATLERDFGGKEGNSQGREELEKLVGAWDCEFLKSRLYFSTLSYVDATMLEEKEGIFDVVLAKMWDKFEQSPCDNRTVRKFEGLKNEVRDLFLKVRECYLVQRKISKDILADEKEISTLDTLHKLSGSINLREEFKKLVDRYLKFMAAVQNCDTDQYYLVIAIDDIDMGIKNAHELLEQIRRFLMIPKVIVLVTADWRRLVRICSCYEENTYGKDNERKEEKEQFVNNYLGKVLPHNKRIYMPDFREPDGELKQSFEIELDFSKEKIYHNEKDSIAYIYSRYLKMYLYMHEQERHILQNNSLRSLVNYFSDFIEMVNANQKRENTVFRKQLLQWMKNDLRYRIAEKIKQEELKQFWEYLFSVDVRRVGEVICHYLSEELEDNEDPYSELYNGFCTENSYGYGAVIYGCILLQKNGFSYTEFCEALILFVTWIQGCNRLSEQKIAWLEDFSFGNWIGMVNAYTDPFAEPLYSMNRIPMEKLELELVGDWDFEEILLKDCEEKEKIEKIKEWFVKFFSKNKDKIIYFQLLMYAFAGGPYTKLEDVPLTIRDDWTGKGTTEFSFDGKKKTVNTEDTNIFRITVTTMGSKRVYGWMNFIRNSQEDQYEDSSKWLLNCIIQPIIMKIIQKFLSKHPTANIPEQWFISPSIDLSDIENELPSKAYKDWIINKNKNILPYDNPQLLYGIGKKLEAEGNPTFNANVSNALCAKKYKLVADELNRLDEYYEKDLHYEGDLYYERDLHYGKTFSDCPYIKMMHNAWKREEFIELFNKLFPPAI